jgi:hypothetical protein
MNQMDIHRRTVRMTASTMTALQAVTQAVLEEINNHGTLGWHCQHLASIDLSATVSFCIAMFVFHTC